MKQVTDLKTRPKKVVSNNKGQAAIEYILLISVIVGLVVGLSSKFKQFSAFTKSYYQDYISCLLSYGELPSLGITEDELKQHLDGSLSTCNVQFKNFTLAEGRPPVNGAGSASSGVRDKRSAAADAETKGSASSSGGSNSNSKNGSDRDKSDSLGGRGGSSGTSASPYKSGAIRRTGVGQNTADSGGSGGEKVTLLDEDEDAKSKAGRRTPGSQRRTIYRYRDKYKAITGEQAEEFIKKSSRTTTKGPQKRTIAKAPNEGGERLGPRVGSVKVPEKPIVEKVEKDEGWGFGKLIKWLLIIGMIVAIVIFFGGQILNYSNSD